jgi:hypothetical protein
MSARWLSEQTVLLIQKEIKNNIVTALGDVRAERSDFLVTTEPPPTQSYFYYEGAKGYRCPAIFTIIDSMDMMNSERAANYINAQARVIVSVVIEDRKQDLLNIKCWRYQSALHQILHLASLTSDDGRVRLECRVARVLFGREFSDALNNDVPAGVFRKEVALHLDVDHYENL